MQRLLMLLCLVATSGVTLAAHDASPSDARKALLVQVERLEAQMQALEEETDPVVRARLLRNHTLGLRDVLVLMRARSEAAASEEHGSHAPQDGAGPLSVAGQGADPHAAHRGSAQPSPTEEAPDPHAAHRGAAQPSSAEAMTDPHDGHGGDSPEAGADPHAAHGAAGGPKPGDAKKRRMTGGGMKGKGMTGGGMMQKHAAMEARVSDLERLLEQMARNLAAREQGSGFANTAAGRGVQPSGASGAGDLLRDREWRLRSLAVRGEEIALPAGATVTLTLAADGRANGRGPVNRYFGGYRFDDTGRFDWSGPLATTRMAGPPALMTFEGAYLEALARVAVIALEGDALTLRDEASTVELVFVR